jgi:Tfp pilus assembly protein PilF
MRPMGWFLNVGMVLALPCLAMARGGDQAGDSYKTAMEALNNGKWDEAIQHFSKAIEADPKQVASYLGRCRAYYAKGNYDKSIVDCDQAISLDPMNAEAFYYRGRAYQFKGTTDRAIEDYSTAIRLDPKHAAAWANRGYLNHEMKKDYEQAKKDYEQSLKLDPKIPNTHNNLGWLLATCPEAKLRDGKTAVACATKACELTQWKSALFLDTLAAAHAEAGNFPEAVKWQKKALEKPEEFPKEEVENAKLRLKLYLKGKPYRVE